MMADFSLEPRRPLKWHERLGDLANAILVKETRQALKSRQFVAAFFLLLAGAWVVSLFGLLQSGAAVEFGPVGRDFFFRFYVVLAVATLIIVPFGAYRSLLSEREQNTWELLSITTLKPRQIVWGKLLSAMLQLFLFYSAITPFMAFASLLQGFDAPTAFYVLALSMLASLLLSMAALMCSTLARQRTTQGVMSLAVLTVLALSLYGAVRFVFLMLRDGRFLVSMPEFWWINGFALLAAASYFALFQQITTAQLTFESDNRSSGIRFVVAVQFWLLWAAYAGYLIVRRASPDARTVTALAAVSTAHWFVAGLFAVTERDGLSRRVRRSVPRLRWLRPLVAPLFPGGSRGLLFALLHLAALWWIVAVVQSYTTPVAAAMSRPEFFRGLFAPPESDSWNGLTRLATGMCCYVIVYLGVAAALGRWLHRLSNEIQPSHVRVFAVLLFTAAYITPMVLEAVELLDRVGYSPIDILDPRKTLEALHTGRPVSTQIIWTLLAGGFISIALNAPAMARQVADVVRGQRSEVRSQKSEVKQ